MTHGSLFSGIGGFDLAAEWMGWENKFHCEWNEFGQKVLKYYWPNAESFSDITKTNFTKYAGTIDIISGGFPCQPYSMAGKRLGKEDERHLWPHMLRTIQEIKPRWVVGENVRGLVSWGGGLVFHEVQADLEAEGYEVQPFLLPACGVNAPHRRDRIWFVAYSNNKGRSSGFGQVQKENGKVPQRDYNAEFGNPSDRAASNTNNPRTNIELPSNRQWEKDDEDWGFSQPKFGENDDNGFASNTKNLDALRLGENNGNRESFDTSKREGVWGELGDISGKRDATNSKCQRSQRPSTSRKISDKEEEMGRKGNKSSIRASSIHTESNAADWETFPTVSPICNGDDGLSNRLDSITFSKWRNESIKAGGNAIVPQVALQIFKAIQAYEDGNR